MVMREQQAYAAALRWYLDQGVDEALADNPSTPIGRAEASAQIGPSLVQPLISVPESAPVAMVTLGRSDARLEAIRLASAAQSLSELREAIASFEGIAIKKTATNLVFADGNPKARVMIIGEAPGADDDKTGRSFMGPGGQMLDRILKWVGLDRNETDPAQAVYLSNILNWRPPGNRTPSPAEIELSLPFIQRHIALVKPQLLIVCGAVAAQGLLGSSDSISKLRKTWHPYIPDGGASIPTLATYNPAQLLQAPTQKKAFWADMLAVMEKRDALSSVTALSEP